MTERLSPKEEARVKAVFTLAEDQLRAKMEAAPRAPEPLTARPAKGSK